MSKLQLLYEKLMRIAYIFGGIFFALSLIVFSAAMMTGAFSCSSGTCGVDEGSLFFKATLLPFIIVTLVFIFTGFAFFKLAHKESDLLSVTDYKKAIEEDQTSDEAISRDELYEKLRRGNRKQKVQKVSLFKKISAAISAFSKRISERREEAKKQKDNRNSEVEEQRAEVARLEKERVEREKLDRAHTKLNKTGLILLLSKNTDLSQNNARLFLNSQIWTFFKSSYKRTY